MVNERIEGWDVVCVVGVGVVKVGERVVYVGEKNMYVSRVVWDCFWWKDKDFYGDGKMRI